MSKNDNFTTSVSSVADANHILAARYPRSIFRDEPVLRQKVRDGKAENYEKLFLQFMESTESSLLLMEKEYGVELMKYKKGVSDAMSLAERYELMAERYELKLEKEREKAEEADKKAEEERKRAEEAVFSTVSVCFKFKTTKEQAYTTILETNPNVSIELLKKAIHEVYGE